MFSVRPGMTYNNASAASATATSDPLATIQFFGYPGWLSAYYGDRAPRIQPVFFIPSAFSSPPDLMGRYALGLDYAGQPVLRSSWRSSGESVEIALC